MPSFNQALGHCFSGKKENIQNLSDTKIIIRSYSFFSKGIPFHYNLAKKEYLTSFQNSLVPLFTSRKYISNVYEGEIFHGWASKYFKPSALKITKSLNEFLRHFVEIWGWNLREGAPISLMCLTLASTYNNLSLSFHQPYDRVL